MGDSDPKLIFLIRSKRHSEIPHLAVPSFPGPVPKRVLRRGRVNLRQAPRLPGPPARRAIRKRTQEQRRSSLRPKLVPSSVQPSSRQSKRQPCNTGDAQGCCEHDRQTAFPEKGGGNEDRAADKIGHTGDAPSGPPQKVSRNACPRCGAMIATASLMPRRAGIDRPGRPALLPVCGPPCWRFPSALTSRRAKCC